MMEKLLKTKFGIFLILIINGLIFLGLSQVFKLILYCGLLRAGDPRFCSPVLYLEPLSAPALTVGRYLIIMGIVYPVLLILINKVIYTDWLKLLKPNASKIFFLFVLFYFIFNSSFLDLSVDRDILPRLIPNFKTIMSCYYHTRFPKINLLCPQKILFYLLTLPYQLAIYISLKNRLYDNPSFLIKSVLSPFTYLLNTIMLYLMAIYLSQSYEKLREKLKLPNFFKINRAWLIALVVIYFLSFVGSMRFWD